MAESDDEWSFDPTFLTPDGTELDRVGSDDGGATARHRDPDVLRRMHHDEGLPVSTMAAELGVSATTVRGHMNKHGVELLGHRPEDSLSGSRRSPDVGRSRSFDPDDGSGGPYACPDCGMDHPTEASQHDCMRRHARRRAGPRP